METQLNIAFIMDGNGRWAKAQGKSRSFGHRAGTEVIKDVTVWCAENNIKSATFYAFSTDNWKREEKEVKFLMKLPFEAKEKYFDRFKDENWQFKLIGERTRLDKKLLKFLEEIETETKDNTGLIVNLALNYGSRDEIIRAANKVEGKITEENLQAALDMPENIDLLIRTSGEQRLSNFLLWQLSYAEFYFTKTLWPDVTTTELDEILNDYKKRDRRFGGY